MKKLTIALMLLLAIAGCKKSDTATPTDNTNTTVTGNDGKYLTKVTYFTPSTGKEATLYELTLDASGLLTGLKTYQTTGTQIYDFTALEKNTTGAITKISGTDKGSNAAVFYNFTYDASGNVSQATFTVGSTVNMFKTYTYDASNRLTVITERNGANTQTNSITTYTYTGTSGSPTSAKVEVKNTFPQTTTNYTYQFDDKTNPIAAAPKIMYYMGMLDFWTNNVTKQSDDSNFTINYTYQYNSKGVATEKKASSDAGLRYYYAQ